MRFRGVWILSDTPRNLRAVAWAGMLRSGPNARLTGMTCLQLHGLDIPSSELFLSVPSNTSVLIEDAVVLRDRNRVQTRSRVGQFSAVSRQRAIVDALRMSEPSQGREVLHEVLRLRWLSVQQLDWWCDQLAGHKGLLQLRAHAVYAKSGVRADSERILGRILKRAALSGWQFNHEIRDSSGVLIAVGDCVNVAVRIVVEVDGMAWHTSRDRFQRDRTRQNALVNAGWHVLRFTWTDLTSRPNDVISQIRAALSNRVSESGPCGAKIQHPV